MPSKYYSLVKAENKATLNIYGDITSYPWSESDVSAFSIVTELDNLDVDEIDVYINSYGGEVAEGLAIHNALLRHKATITTYDDGFACSIASIVFMAGDIRVMADSSLLMIHNPWTSAYGKNAEGFRKVADDLDIMKETMKKAYLNKISIKETELDLLLEEETFLTADQCLEKGFATKIEKYAISDKVQLSTFDTIRAAVLNKKQEIDVQEKLHEPISVLDRLRKK